MAQKSRELDSQLKELLTPIGFKKVPKTRYFIRMCGDGAFQGVFWNHEPRYTAQNLMIWINSIFSDPDHLFRKYLSWRNAAIMLSPINCSEYIYLKKTNTFRRGESVIFPKKNK